MKKVTLILGAVVCGIGILAASCLAFSTINKPLLEFSYSSGGGMRGGYKATSVNSLDNNYAIIVTKEAAWHGIDAVSQEYKVPKSVLVDIRDIFNKHKMGNSDKAFKSPFKVLDKGTSSYSFVFENKKVEFDSEQMLSEGTRKGIKEILAYISKQCQAGEKLPGLEVPNPKDEPKNLMRPIEGKLAMEVFDYQGNIMYVRIANGLETSFKAPLSFKLFKQGVEKVLITEQQGKNDVKISSKRSEEYQFKLSKRLERGEYILRIADLETTFELK